jgi:hypothetical protein
MTYQHFFTSLFMGVVGGSSTGLVIAKLEGASWTTAYWWAAAGAMGGLIFAAVWTIKYYGPPLRGEGTRPLAPPHWVARVSSDPVLWVLTAAQLLALVLSARLAGTAGLVLQAVTIMLTVILGARLYVLIKSRGPGPPRRESK